MKKYIELEYKGIIYRDNEPIAIGSVPGSSEILVCMQHGGGRPGNGMFSTPAIKSGACHGKLFVEVSDPYDTGFLEVVENPLPNTGMAVFESETSEGFTYKGKEYPLFTEEQVQKEILLSEPIAQVWWQAQDAFDSFDEAREASIEDIVQAKEAFESNSRYLEDNMISAVHELVYEIQESLPKGDENSPKL